MIIFQQKIEQVSHVRESEWCINEKMKIENVIVKKVKNGYWMPPHPLLDEQAMKEFEVEITETLQRTVVIRAGSRAEAEVLAEEMWNNEEFVLGAEDFVGAEFSAVSEKEITPKCRKRKDEMER